MPKHLKNGHMGEIFFSLKQVVLGINNQELYAA
jgi:hypothetical protein